MGSRNLTHVPAHLSKAEQFLVESSPWQILAERLGFRDKQGGLSHCKSLSCIGRRNSCPGFYSKKEKVLIPFRIRTFG